MVHPNRRARRGFPVLPLLLVIIVIGGLVALAMMEPSYDPAAVTEEVPSDRLPL